MYVSFKNLIHNGNIFPYSSKHSNFFLLVNERLWKNNSNIQQKISSVFEQEELEESYQQTSPFNEQRGKTAHNDILQLVDAQRKF